MLYTSRNKEGRTPDEVLYSSLEPVILGLGMSLIELALYQGKAGNVQIRVVVFRTGITGVEDCSRAHRALLPRLELAFPGQDIYLEVSSPGIDRIIKDGSEFVHYIGKGVRCFRTDISDWTAGILSAADEEKIVLREKNGETVLPYAVIAKARLSGEV